MDICRLKMRICKLEMCICRLKTEFVQGFDKFFGENGKFWAGNSRFLLYGRSIVLECFRASALKMDSWSVERSFFVP